MDREVALFYTGPEPRFDHPSSEETLRRHADRIHRIIGFWHQIEQRGGDRLVPYGETTDTEIERAVAWAGREGVSVEGLFHNLLYGRTKWSRDVASRLLEDREAQERLIGDIAATAARHGFTGVNADLEHVPPPFRAALGAFVERLAEVLREDDRQLSLSVPAKTRDDPLDGWSGAFDYRRLGSSADRLIVMTYDEHGYVSGPGPIASIGWVKSVLAYALTAVPAAKLIVGLAGYGFDWPLDGGRPRMLSHAQAVARAKASGAVIERDEVSGSPTYTYVEGGRRREVWFEDARSSAAKLRLVSEYDLGGIALWRGGLEDPALWDAVTREFGAVGRPPRGDHSESG